MRFLGTDHHEVHCTGQEIGRVFPDVIWHTEKPILRTAPAPLYILSGLVRRHGYKVVLTGEGSDEMLGGYDIFKEAKIRRFVAAHPESRTRPLLLKRLYPYLEGLQAVSSPYLKAFFEAGAGDTRNPFFSHMPRWQSTSRLKMLFAGDVRAEIGSYDACQEMGERLPADYPRWDGLGQAQYP